MTKAVLLGFDPERAAAKAAKRKEKSANRESKVEADGKKRVKAAGGLSYKFRSPAHNAVPDQIEFYGVKPMMMRAAQYGYLLTSSQATELLASAIQLTEYKAPGETPTGPQAREHATLRSMGFTVNVIDERTTK